jgi:hypothetical protein
LVVLGLIQIVADVTEQHGRRGLVGTPRDAAICASERPAASCAARALSLSPRPVGDDGTSSVQLCLSATSGFTFPAVS